MLGLQRFDGEILVGRDRIRKHVGCNMATCRRVSIDVARRGNEVVMMLG